VTARAVEPMVRTTSIPRSRLRAESTRACS
jgi:hypothetical protein